MEGEGEIERELLSAAPAGPPPQAALVVRLAGLLAPGLPPAQIAGGVVEAACTLFGCPAAWVLVRHEGELRLIGSRGLPPAAEKRIGHLPLDAPAVETAALELDQALGWKQGELPPAVEWSARFLDEAGLPGIVAVPFRQSGVQAVVGLGRAKPLGEAELELMQAIGTIGTRALAAMPDPVGEDAGSADAKLAAIRAEIVRCRKVEAQLRDSEERFRLTVDEAPIGIAVVSLTGRHQRVNRVMTQILGFDEGELLKLRWQAITHPDDLGKDVGLAEDLVAGNIPSYEIEKRYIRKDGSVVLCLVGVSLVRDARGAPWYFITRIQDVTEQRRLEERLRFRERKFRGLFDASLDPIFITDDEARFVDVNPAALELLGMPREELVGARIGVLRSRIVDLDLGEAWRRLQAEGTLKGEFEVRTATGERRVLEFAAKSQFIPGRNLSVLRDVTERVCTAKALRRREEQLAEAQRIAQVGHWEIDLGGDRIRASAEAFRIFGYPGDQGSITRDELLQAIHPDDRERARAALWDVVEAGGSFDIVHRIVCLDGTVRTVHERGRALRLRGTVRMLGTVQDVTERQRAADEREQLLAALATKSRWLDMLIDRSPVAILLVGEDGKMRANRRANELLGRIPPDTPPGGIVARMCDEAGSPIDSDRMPLWRAIAGEAIQAEEICFRSPDDTVVSAVVSAGSIRDEQGEQLGAVAIIEDITRLKDLERLREEWTSVVAHDLRQPVTVIHAQAQLLARHLGNSNPIVEGKLEHIVTASRQLSRMIGDLLDVTRIESRRVTLDRQPVELESFALAVVERHVAELAGNRVEVRVVGDVPPVWADPLRVEQILSNLLSNAAKYGRAGGPIEIELRAVAGSVSVKVSNEGEGIPPGELAELFTRFHRTRDARRGPVRGLGLGLYITRGLVEAHGGAIFATSVPGGKTSFNLTLPTAAEARR